MSLRWMSAVFAASEPRGTDRLMLLALADNANDEGVCWPSVETLQRKCGLGTRRAAEKALRRVEAWSTRAPAGCVRLRVEERAGRSSVYHLDLSDDPPVAVPAPESGDGPEPQAGGERQDGRSLEREDGPASERRDGGPSNRRTGEPSMNPHLNPQQHAAHARSDVRGDGIRSIGDVLPPSGDGATAAAFLREDEGDALLRTLTSRGVDRPVALRLVRRYPERIAPIVERFDAERGRGTPKGPGWLVAAIREGYAVGGSRSAPLLSYAEMLAACDREGVTTDAFEAVPQPDGQKPLWRRKTKGTKHRPAGGQ